MDAPEISTLRDDSSPPAPAHKTVSAGKLKLKLNVAEPSASKPEPLPVAPKSTAEEGEDDMDEEPEDQEDQLIDDDDEAPPSHASSKRKSPAKPRKPRKSDKQRPAEDTQEPNTAGPTTLSWVEAVSTVQFEQPVASPPEKQPPAAGQKRKAVKKPAGAPKPKRAKRTTALPVLTDDADLMSEGLTGSAASSPVTAPFDGQSSDAEPEPLSLDPLTTIEDGPYPVYPLPSKPFPVQPAPKMPTGFAPVIPLDRSSKRCRRWRVANREIRGIAGGRWFTRSWVGDKELDSTAAPPKVDKEENGGTSSLALSGPHGLSKMRGVVAVGPASDAAVSDAEP